MRLAGKIALIVVMLWLAFVATVYTWMQKPPEQFAAKMAKLPMPAMMAFPFETMWNRARAGSLAVGDSAPDFELPTVDKQSRVRLSGYHGRPVVLVFGSYT